MDEKFMENLKEQVGNFLNNFMPVAEFLNFVSRIDLNFEKYDLTVYKVKDLIRIDIKDKTLDKGPK